MFLFLYGEGMKEREGWKSGIKAAIFGFIKVMNNS
jgi:hypothetical protein